MCWHCVGDYLEAETGTELADGELDRTIAEVSKRPAVAAAAEQIAVLYRMPECCTGGPLHVVVDDTNVEDEFLEPYRPEGETLWAEDAYTQADRVLALLRPLTLVERAVATVVHGEG
ncbi:hypothetical protein [Nocardia nova]|uniref:hypothetical protein n=1 Tax=Nocardia nova TaxID=37330 RepID=UPI0018961B04|nr:hypothetical protein [Nocardia nova]MBF6277041.1 hypothetical protein [Nocardia nova]